MPHSLPPRATAVLLALVLALLAFRLGSGAAPRPRRAPLHARRGRDAPGRRVGDAHAPGRALAREAAALLLARGRRLLRPRRDGGRGPAALGARRAAAGRGDRPLRRAPLRLGRGPARRVRGRDVAPALRLRPRRVDGHAARGHGDGGDRPRRPPRCSASPGASRSSRPRLRPASRRSPRARSGCSCPSLVLGGYLLATREWRWLRELLSPAAVAAFALVAAPWYVAILARPGPALRRRLHPQPQRRSASRPRSTTTRGPSGTTCPSCWRASSRGRGSPCPPSSASRPRASRADLFVLLWLRAAARLLLARRLEAPRLHPALRPAARHPDGPRRGPADPRRDGTPERLLSSRVVALVGLGAGGRSSPRRRPRSSASRSRCGARPSRSAVWALVVAFLFSRRVGARPAGRPALCCGSAGPACCCCSPSRRRPSSPAASPGRGLFAPAMGREVLAWGAWRTAWMAGYFYNDGKVREVEQASEILAAIDSGADAGSGRARRSAGGSRPWARSRCTCWPRGRGRTCCCAVVAETSGR